MPTIIKIAMPGEEVEFGCERYPGGTWGFYWFNATKGTVVWTYDHKKECVTDMAHCIKNKVLVAFGLPEEDEESKFRRWWNWIRRKS